jgi:uncharacterized protein
VLSDHHLFKLEIPDLPGGIEVPYVRIDGEKDGPRVTILAGVHGAEYPGMQAVRRFINAVDPAQLSGTITAVPVVSVTMFWERAAFVTPADGKNPNRNFPGDPAGSFTEIFTHAIFKNFIEGADYLLDLHGGDLPEALEPVVIYSAGPMADASRGLAKAYGLEHIIRMGADDVPGSTDGAAEAIGVPAIIAEAGGNGLTSEEAVALHERGIENVLRHLSVLPGEVSAPARQTEYPDGWAWSTAPSAGWWDPKVELGTPIEENALLGTISDLYGRVLHEIRAPHAGTALCLTSSPAVKENGLLIAVTRGHGLSALER